MAAEVDEGDRARRFRDAALPHLDAVYTAARYLLRDASDADDAVQECYLRAFRHFDTFRGPNIRPWLMAILRNVCRAEFERRGKREQPLPPEDADPAAIPLWREDEKSADDHHDDGERMRSLVAGLPEPFRETLVLREIEDLSYREIAEAVGAPVGTVMSRLARARTMLRDAWRAGPCKGRPS